MAKNDLVRILINASEGPNETFPTLKAIFTFFDQFL